MLCSKLRRKKTFKLKVFSYKIRHCFQPLHQGQFNEILVRMIVCSSVLRCTWWRARDCCLVQQLGGTFFTRRREYLLNLWRRTVNARRPERARNEASTGPTRRKPHPRSACIRTSWIRQRVRSEPPYTRGSLATWKREFKFLWLEAGPPNHHGKWIRTSRLSIKNLSPTEYQLNGFSKVESPTKPSTDCLLCLLCLLLVIVNTYWTILWGSWH